MEIYLWMIIVVLGIFNGFLILMIIRNDSLLEDANLEIRKHEITISRMKNRDY